MRFNPEELEFKDESANKWEFNNSKPLQPIECPKVEIKPQESVDVFESANQTSKSETLTSPHQQDQKNQDFFTNKQLDQQTFQQRIQELEISQFGNCRDEESETQEEKSRQNFILQKIQQRRETRLKIKLIQTLLNNYVCEFEESILVDQMLGKKNLGRIFSAWAKNQVAKSVEISKNIRRKSDQDSFSGCRLESGASQSTLLETQSPAKTDYWSDRQAKKAKFQEFKVGESALKGLEAQYISIDQEKNNKAEVKTPIAPPVTEIKTDFEQEVDELIRDFQRFKVLPKVFKALKIYSDVQKDLREARIQGKIKG